MNANHPVVASVSWTMPRAWMVLCVFMILGLVTACTSLANRDSASVFDGTAIVGQHQITITPSKTEGFPGEKVTARLTVKNTGTEPLWVPLPLSQCLDLQFAPVNEIVIDDPFLVPTFTCRQLDPNGEISVEKTFVVPDTTSQCEFFAGYSHLRAYAVPFTVLKRLNPPSAISVH